MANCWVVLIARHTAARATLAELSAEWTRLARRAAILKPEAKKPEFSTEDTKGRTQRTQRKKKAGFGGEKTRQSFWNKAFLPFFFLIRLCVCSSVLSVLNSVSLRYDQPRASLSHPGLPDHAVAAPLAARQRGRRLPLRAFLLALLHGGARRTRHRARPVAWHQSAWPVAPPGAAWVPIPCRPADRPRAPAAASRPEKFVVPPRDALAGSTATRMPTTPVNAQIAAAWQRPLFTVRVNGSTRS